MKIIEQLTSYVDDLQDTIKELKDTIGDLRDDNSDLASDLATAKARLAWIAEEKEARTHTLIKRVGEMRVGENFYHPGQNAIAVLMVAAAQHKPKLFTGRRHTERGILGARLFRLL